MIIAIYNISWHHYHIQYVKLFYHTLYLFTTPERPQSIVDDTIVPSGDVTTPVIMLTNIPLYE